MNINLQDMVKKPGSWLALGLLGFAAYMLLRALNLGFKQPRRKVQPERGPGVVILGAGFGGLTAARKLRQRVGDRARITLIDRHDYHLFTPLLFQVATCGVDPYDIAYPIRHFAGRHGIDFRRGMVTGIDLDGRRVYLSDGEVQYDYLVIALGTTTNFHGNRAAMEHTLPMKWLEDGVAIRHHVLDMLTQASTAPNAEARQALLTFTIVGGGATGAETAAALSDLLHRVVPIDYPDINPGELRIIVVESENKLLGHMNQKLATITLKQLSDMGVEVWLNSRAKDVGADYITTEDGQTVRTRTVIWTTGVRCPQVVASVRAPHGKADSLVVDDYLQVQGRPGVYAIGDNAHFVDPRTHNSPPLLAAAAIQEGDAAAENLALGIEGQPQVPFKYRNLGNVISLGRSAGAAEFDGVVVDGFIGWLAWRLIHLAKITSFRNKLATVLDWSVGYVYDLDTVRLEVEPISRIPGSSGAEQGG